MLPEGMDRIVDTRGGVDGGVEARTRCYAVFGSAGRTSRVRFYGKKGAFMPGSRFFCLMYRGLAIDSDVARMVEDELGRILPVGTRWFGCISSRWCVGRLRTGLLEVVVDFGPVEAGVVFPIAEELFCIAGVRCMLGGFRHVVRGRGLRDVELEVLESVYKDQERMARRSDLVASFGERVVGILERDVVEE